MDETKIEAFQEGLFTELNSGMSMLTLQLSYHLGYFRSLSEAGPGNGLSGKHGDRHSDQALNSSQLC